MKVVIAIDSFKGSMTSIEAGEAARAGILKAVPDAEVVVKPLADGGEGTTDALIRGLSGHKVSMEVTGPMGDITLAQYGILENEVTAVMEMAQAAGITRVYSDCLNPLRATTRGVGEMIRDAVSRGCRDFLIGIGGSATNDGGLGMLKALGFSFLDKNGSEVEEGAQELEKICEIRSDNVLPELKECSFRIACDVTNPLCGKHGATYVYGPQKGLKECQLDKIDEGMGCFAEVAEKFMSGKFREISGAGAAGGLGFAFLAFMNGKLIPGVDLVLDVIELDEELKNADIVITGEGQLDRQTAMGKATIGVAKRAKKYNIPVLAFAGGVMDDANLCNESGIDSYFSIVRRSMSLKEAMQPDIAKKNMEHSVEQVFRLIQRMYVSM